MKPNRGLVAAQCLLDKETIDISDLSNPLHQLACLKHLCQARILQFSYSLLLIYCASTSTSFLYLVTYCLLFSSRRDIANQPSTMASRPTHGLRERKLYGIFMNTLEGKKEIKSVADAKLFLDAIISQNDVITCVEKILSNGLHAFQTSLRIDVSVTFLNQSAGPLLKYLQDPSLEIACGGDYMQQITRALVQPAIFWNALLKAHKTRQLDDDTVQGFSWLLLRLLHLPEDENTSNYRVTAIDDLVQLPLLESARLDIRTVARKIKHVCDTTNRPNTDEIINGPGGRHDNDFEDLLRSTFFLPLTRS